MEEYIVMEEEAKIWEFKKGLKKTEGDFTSLKIVFLTSFKIILRTN